MKKKIIIGRACAFIVLLLIIVGSWGLSRGKQSDSKDDGIITNETENDEASDGQTKDSNNDADNRAESNADSNKPVDDKDNKNATTDSKTSVSSDDGIELPLEIIKDDEGAANENEESGDKKPDKVVTDNGNELPVDRIN